MLTVELSGNTSDVQIQLINAHGEVLINEIAVSKSNQYDLGKYPNGLYFVKITENKRVIRIEKVIKQ
jgi:hypothetical protein